MLLASPFIAAALSSATVPASASQLHIVFGAKNIPHPIKAGKGGEDAYFFDDNLGTFGIADGVGGSADKAGKVDPGAFSREMLRRCHEAAGSGDDGAVLPISDALRLASEAPLDLGGSATLLLGQVDPNEDKLMLLNLGDSGALLLRPSFRRFRKVKGIYPRTVLRSADQTHFFNCPYQACAETFGAIGGGAQLDKLSAEVRDGDVLIVATDGVLDNLFDRELQACVAQHLPGLRSPDPVAAQAEVDQLAATIAGLAHAIGLREDEQGLLTPFMQAAAEEGYSYPGGKLDDVAVVCGVVRSGERPPRRVGHNFAGCEAELRTVDAVDSRGVVVPSALSEAAYSEAESAERQLQSATAQQE
jgi:protein phosphatase PTC7